MKQKLSGAIPGICGRLVSSVVSEYDKECKIDLSDLTTQIVLFIY